MGFTATLQRMPGKGGWTFVVVPPGQVPPVTRGWGRTPVHAEIEGRHWDATVWRDKTHGAILSIPKQVHAGREPGTSWVVVIHGPRDGR